MPDATGLKGLLMSGRSSGILPKKKGADVNLPAEKKKKGFLDRFIQKDSQADKVRSGFETFRNLAKKK